VQVSAPVRRASQHTIDTWSSSCGAAVRDGSCRRAQRAPLTAQNPSACSQEPLPVPVSRTCSRQSVGPSSPTLVSSTCIRQAVGLSSPTLMSHRCSNVSACPPSPWLTPRAIQATTLTGRL